MKRRNVFSCLQYALVTCFLYLAAFTIYCNKYFLCALTSYSASMNMLRALACISILLGYAASMEHNRNLTNILATVLWPFGLYSIIAYRKEYPWIIGITIVVTLLTVCFLSHLIMSRSINPNADIKYIKHIRRLHCVRCSRIIMAFGLSLFLLFLCLTSHITVPSMSRNVKPSQYGPYGEKYTIGNNIETLMLLEQDTWAELDRNTRLDVLQTVANIETNYLGLSHELMVKAANMEDGTLGSYDESTHTVTISEVELTTGYASDCVDTICHEAYHAYQHEVIEVLGSIEEEPSHLLFFRNAAQWRYEFDNYIGGSEDFFQYLEYRYQSVEEDAREYAWEAVEDYYYAISTNP